MPPPPSETKHHPSAVDQLLIKELIASTPTKTLVDFLQREFTCIDASLAKRLINELGGDFSQEMKPSELTHKHVIRLQQLFSQVKFKEPSADVLAQAGEYNLRLGVMKEIRPEYIATYSTSPSSYQGHPFIVESAISVGTGLTFRFATSYSAANKIPKIWQETF